MSSNASQDDGEVHRMKVICELFAKQHSDGDDMTEYNTYFEHYDKQIGLLGNHGVDEPAGRVLLAVEEMRSNPNKSKTSLRHALIRPQDSVEKVDRIINCAVRVWLMIDCRLEEEPQNSTALHWNEEDSLLQFVDHAFRIPPTDRGKLELDETDRTDMRKEALEATGRLTHRLTGMNLERYSNIKTIPTDYLHQHLFFDQSYFHTFKHRRWLLDTIAIWDSSTTPQGTQSHQSTIGCNKKTPAEETSSSTKISAVPSSSKGAPASSNPFGSSSASGSSNASGNSKPPTDKIQSTRSFPILRRILVAALCSNDYLFPPEDLKAEEFLRKRGVENWTFKEDTMEMRSRQYNLRHIQHYQYHDGMVDLAHEFNSPPKGIGTIWKDRRNPIQFFTFWFGLAIAFFTFSFGVTQLTLASIRFAKST